MMSSAISRFRFVYTPLIIVVTWLIVSTSLFLLGPYAGITDNVTDVLAFVGITVAAIGLGYWIAVATRRDRPMDPSTQGVTRHPGIAEYSAVPNFLILMAGFWFLAYGLSILSVMGVGSPAQLVAAIANPRDSYFGKFVSFSEAQRSALGQLLNLMGLLYFLLVPYALTYIRRASRVVLAVSLLGITVYVCAYLASGTQRGVVDIAIFLVVSSLALSARRTQKAGRTPRRRAPAWILVVPAIAAVVTIVWSLGLRSDATSSSIAYEGSQRQIAQLTPYIGDIGARGVVVLLSYASQGYYGLSLALKLPWDANGVGSGAPALSSLLVQYFGATDPTSSGYLARVEDSFGWSATIQWSTVFPWIASDITFVGAVLFCAILSFIVARIWLGYLDTGSAWQLGLINVTAIAVVYMPANNQLFIDRFAAYGIVSIMVVQIFRAFHSRRGAGVLLGNQRRFDVREPAL